MNHTTVSSFTHAAQQAQQWVNEPAEDLNWDERRAYRLLRSVLQVVRDWLSPEEMADLSAPVWERSKQDFVARVEGDFADDMLYDADAVISAVFRLLDRHVSHGEIVQVRNSMKKSLRHLWPAD